MLISSHQIIQLVQPNQLAQQKASPCQAWHWWTPAGQGKQITVHNRIFISELSIFKFTLFCSLYLDARGLGGDCFPSPHVDLAYTGKASAIPLTPTEQPSSR